MRMLTFAFLMLSSGTALAMPVPDCAGEVEISRAKIVRVEKNGALILSDGRAVLLEGIRLASADGASAIGDRALANLRDLATAASLSLASTPPKQDRYDRVRVQAFGNVWLQDELLRRGLARVEISPDRSECAVDFYAAERDARGAGRGLWALNAFAVRPATSLSSDIGRYVVVEGKVVNVGNADGRVFLDFASDFRKDFSAIIQPEDRKAFREPRFRPMQLAGHEVRLRGIVQNLDGRAQIALTNPAQVEILN